MGQDKALVPLGGKPMVEHVIAAVRPISDSLLLVTNYPETLAFLNLPMVGDREPGAGALPGLQTALSAASSELVLLVACDMPFVSTPLLRYLIERVEQADAAVPIWADRFQPTCAVYRREPCLAAVEAALAAGKKRMIGWFEAVEVVGVDSAEIEPHDPTGRTFFNVNTPDELMQAERMLEAF